MSDTADAKPRRPRATRGRRAVVILASGEAAEAADRLRRRFDPEWFERVPPHVSLVEAFDPSRIGVDEEIARRVREAVSGTGPFRLVLARPGAFVAPRLVLYLSVAEACGVRGVQERVREGLGLPAPERLYVPHLTVARAHSEDALAAALGALKAEIARRPPGAPPWGFDVDAVQLFGEDPETGVYSSVASIPLAGAHGLAAAAP